MHTFHVILRIIGVICGLGLVCMAVFLKEDEEQNLINLIDQWWKKLEDKSRVATTLHEKILLKSFISSNIILDNIFGEKIFSIRFFITSFNLSVSSILIIVSLFSGICDAPIIPLIVAVIACFISVLQGKSRLFIYLNYSCFFFLFCYATYNIIPAINKDSPNAFLPFTIGTSLLIDVTVILISKYLIHKIVMNYSLRRLIFTLLISSLFVVILIIIPLLLLFSIDFNQQSNVLEIHLVRTISDIVGHSPQLENLLGDSNIQVNIILGANSNIFSSFPITIAFLSALVFFIHKLTWPVIIRPVYALKRFGVFKYRKTVGGLGLTIFIVSITGSPTELAHGILEIFGGKLK